MTAVVGGAPAGADRARIPPAPGPAGSPYGRLPETSLLVALGLLGVSVAYAGGRAGASWPVPVYWLGQLTMFLPPLLRLLTARRITARECQGTALVLGSAYFATAYCYSPAEFKFVDELQHWRTATNILTTGRLFDFNYSLPISPSYPGLESVTAAVVQLGGLPLVLAGFAVMAVARVLLTGALYLLFRRIGGSPRVAALGSVLFTTAPYYKAVLAKFIYGGLALPFLLLACDGALLAASAAGRRERRAATGTAALAVAVTVVTHHLTSWILGGVLMLAGVVLHLRGSERGARVVAGLTAWCLTCVGAWIVVVAPGTPAYLSPAVSDIAAGVAGLLGGAEGPSDGGFVRAPPTEAVPSYVAVLVIAVSVVLGVRHVLRRHRADPWLLVTAVVASAYLAVPVLRVVSRSGSEDAQRAQTYVFVGVALVLALAGWAWVRTSPRRGRAIGACTVVATIAMVGGVTSGWPSSWARIPSDRVVVDGYENAVGPEGVAAAYWAQDLLPDGRRILADNTNSVLMGPYGQQDMVHGSAELFYAPDLRESDRAEIVADRIEYLVTDRRLTRALPAGGSYYPDDPLAFRYTTPLPLSGMTKYDRLDGVARVLDSGEIVLYDLRGLDRAP